MDANEQTIDRIHDRTSHLIVALTDDNPDLALRTARDLRSTLDGLIADLTRAQFLPATAEEFCSLSDAELSEVAHD